MLIEDKAYWYLRGRTLNKTKKKSNNLNMHTFRIDSVLTSPTQDYWGDKTGADSTAVQEWETCAANWAELVVEYTPNIIHCLRHIHDVYGGDSTPSSDAWLSLYCQNHYCKLLFFGIWRRKSDRIVRTFNRNLLMMEASGSFKILGTFLPEHKSHITGTSNLLRTNTTTRVDSYKIKVACVRNISDNVQCPPL